MHILERVKKKHIKTRSELFSLKLTPQIFSLKIKVKMVRCMPPQNATFQHPAMPRSRRGPTHQTLIIHVVEKDDGGDSLAATASPPSRRFDFPHDSPRLLGHHFLSNLLFFSFLFFFIFSLRIGGAGDFSSSRLRSSFLFCVSCYFFFFFLRFLVVILAPAGVNSALFAVGSCRVFVFFF